MIGTEARHQMRVVSDAMRRVGKVLAEFLLVIWTAQLTASVRVLHATGSGMTWQVE